MKSITVFVNSASPTYQNRFDISIVHGDTWGGLAVTLTLDGAPVNLTGASLHFQARQSYYETPVLDLSTTAGTIVLTTPTAGQFTILAVPFASFATNTQPGDYAYDLEFTLADGSVWTYLFGTLTITTDVTHV